MKRLAVIFLAAFSITFTGCIDIIEEVFLKNDGTGKFTLTMDMSGLMQNEFMKSLIEEEMDKNTEGDASNGIQDMDSTFYFSDAPDSIRAKFADNPEFLEKVAMRTKVSEADGEFKIAFDLDFEKLSDIDYFFQNLAKLQEGTDGPGDMEGLFPSVGQGQKLYALAGKKFKRMDTSSGMSEMGMNEEDLSMMKMMFSGANYKTIYHLPGKVKKTSNPASEISDDKKTVTTTIPMLDYLEGKANAANEVKFKKK
ncbi:MAG: hypothetical protein AAF502_01740 [Bacteroidota bacterium]